MTITYRDLLDRLKKMHEKRLDDHVTIYDSETDEHHAVSHLSQTQGSDVLDDGHLILEINRASTPLVKGDVVYIDFNNSKGTKRCTFDRMDGSNAIVNQRGLDGEEEISVDLSDVYFGEYDEKSVAILIRER